MAGDNFEKLFGKDGELVEFRRKQMLHGAARLLYTHCKQNHDRYICNGCSFLYGGFCTINEPCLWDLSEVQDDE